MHCRSSSAATRCEGREDWEDSGLTNEMVPTEQRLSRG